MRTAIAATVALLVPTWTVAAPPEITCYVGEVKLTTPAGKPIGSQAILVEKTHDPDHRLIVERAIVVQPDGKVQEQTVRLSVKDDNTFTAVDDAKFVEGSGTLFGPAWKWTYFKASFKAKNGVQIEDENFLADQSVGTARKKLTGPDGQVMMYMDMSLKSVTPKTFEILRAGLMKK